MNEKYTNDLYAIYNIVNSLIITDFEAQISSECMLNKTKLLVENPQVIAFIQQIFLKAIASDIKSIISKIEKMVSENTIDDDDAPPEENILSALKDVFEGNQPNETQQNPAEKTLDNPPANAPEIETKASNETQQKLAEKAPDTPTETAPSAESKMSNDAPHEPDEKTLKNPPVNAPEIEKKTSNTSPDTTADSDKKTSENSIQGKEDSNVRSNFEGCQYKATKQGLIKDFYSLLNISQRMDFIACIKKNNLSQNGGLEYYEKHLNEDIVINPAMAFGVYNLISHEKMLDDLEGIKQFTSNAFDIINNNMLTANAKITENDALVIENEKNRKLAEYLDRQIKESLKELKEKKEIISSMSSEKDKLEITNKSLEKTTNELSEKNLSLEEISKKISDQKTIIEQKKTEADIAAKTAETKLEERTAATEKLEGERTASSEKYAKQTEKYYDTIIKHKDEKIDDLKAEITALKAAISSEVEKHKAEIESLKKNHETEQSNLQLKQNETLERIKRECANDKDNAIKNIKHEFEIEQNANLKTFESVLSSLPPEPKRQAYMIFREILSKNDKNADKIVERDQRFVEHPAEAEHMNSEQIERKNERQAQAKAQMTKMIIISITTIVLVLIIVFGINKIMTAQASAKTSAEKIAINQAEAERQKLQRLHRLTSIKLETYEDFAKASREIENMTPEELNYFNSKFQALNEKTNAATQLKSE